MGKHVCTQSAHEIQYPHTSCTSIECPDRRVEGATAADAPYLNRIVRARDPNWPEMLVSVRKYLSVAINLRGECILTDRTLAAHVGGQ
jgi:hypothetical protein